LQETIEYEYPVRVMVYRMIDKDFREHATIIYMKAGYERRPNAISDFAEYDSTVDEAFLHKVQPNCVDTILTISTTGRYVDSKLNIDLAHKVLGVYYPAGRRTWVYNDLLWKIPCGYKTKKRR
jgi:hypothetical protein